MNFYLVVCLLPPIYLLYRLVDELILQPYGVHRQFWKQGIAGHYTPIIGDVLKIRAAIQKEKPFEYSDQVFDHYGKEYYHSSFGPSARLVIADPSLLQYVLTKNASCYEKTPLMRRSIGQLLGQRNLLLSEGLVHAMHRKAISPCFHHQNLMSMQSLIVQTVDTALQQWDSMRDAEKGYTEFDMHKIMAGLALDVVSRGVFGSEMTNDSKLKDAIYTFLNKTLVTSSGRLLNMTGLLPIIRDLPLPSKRRIERSSEETRQIVRQMIQDRRDGKSSRQTNEPDLLDLLLAAEIDDKVTGQKLSFTDDEIFQHCLTFLLAGHETTSNLMTWCFYYLSENQELIRRAQHEVDVVLKGKAPNSSSDLAALPYIEAILLETLRISGPVSNIVRMCIKDNDIVASDGTKIHMPAGSAVLLHLYRLHHNDTYWPNANKFDPSRFVDGNTSSPSQQPTSTIAKDEYKSDVADIADSYSVSKKRIQPYTLLGFSAGPRSCIGQQFALQEAKTMLAMILQKYDIELVPGQKIVPSVMVTMRVKHGLIVRMRPRQIGKQNGTAAQATA